MPNLTMSKKEIAVFTLFILFVVIWCFLVLRDLTFIFGVSILILTVVYDPQQNKKLMSSLLVMLLISGVTPIEVTFKNVDGSVRLITTCNIRQPSDILRSKIDKTECYMATDIPRPFESTSKIVW